jgi:hypothetical protein
VRNVELVKFSLHYEEAKRDLEKKHFHTFGGFISRLLPNNRGTQIRGMFADQFHKSAGELLELARRENIGPQELRLEGEAQAHAGRRTTSRAHWLRLAYPALIGILLIASIDDPRRIAFLITLWIISVLVVMDRLKLREIADEGGDLRALLRYVASVLSNEQRGNSRRKKAPAAEFQAPIDSKFSAQR